MKTLLLYLRYDDVPQHWARPRRPGVCLLDAFGICSCLLAMFLLVRCPALVVLPLSLLAMYLASFRYHMWEEDAGRRKLDLLMIFVPIAGTQIAFSGHFVPAPDIYLRVVVTIALTTSCMVVKALRHAKLSDVANVSLYFCVASPVVYSAFEMQVWLTPLQACGFWAGCVFYATNGIVNTIMKPDPFPRVFGWRCVQHAAIYGGCTTHLLVAISVSIQ